MMSRIIRQLLGKGRRAAAVEEQLRQHHDEHSRGVQQNRDEVAAVERLVRQFQRDAIT